MPWWAWLLVVLGALVALWAAFVGALYLTGRHSEARALAGFIPDCLFLVRGLLADARVRRRDKVLLVALLGYLALPFDLVPDFIPVVGFTDDAATLLFTLFAVSAYVHTDIKVRARNKMVSWFGEP